MIKTGVTLWVCDVCGREEEFEFIRPVYMFSYFPMGSKGDKKVDVYCEMCHECATAFLSDLARTIDDENDPDVVSLYYKRVKHPTYPSSAD